MTKAKSGFASLIAKASVGLGVMMLSVSAAGAVDSRVRDACAGDYLSYCSQHDPDGRAVRTCMRANGSKLSQGCLNALVAAGEVSKKEITKKRVARRGTIR
jgi:hypothetical protein